MYTKLPDVVIKHKKIQYQWFIMVCKRFQFRVIHRKLPKVFSAKVRTIQSPQLQFLFTYAMYYIDAKKKELDMHNFWFYLYQQVYLGQILKTTTTLKTINSQQIIPRSLLSYMMHSVMSVRWKKYYIMHSNEIIEVLFISLWLKNLTLFMEWMRGYFEKTNLKKHRKLFLLLNYLLGKLIWNYNIFLRLRGLRLVLRGKFGKAGSVRKTRKYIRKGKCTYTSKNIALVNQTNLIRTLTGVFSIKLEIFF